MGQCRGGAGAAAPDGAKTKALARLRHLEATSRKSILQRRAGANMDFMNDIAMEQKGLEYSEYASKESLAQQGGYGLTNKGPQHDEAWLIFMDQVNNQIPTFEDKAEALYYLSDV
mgnify:CR=1 FL=1